MFICNFTGEGAVQTCFEGRFGDDVANDQFGGHIMCHGDKKRNSPTDMKDDPPVICEYIVC